MATRGARNFDMLVPASLGAFLNAHGASATSVSRFVGGASQKLVIPRGHTAYIWGISAYTPSTITGNSAVMKLYVDGVDQSASFTTDQALDSTHPAGSFRATTAPFVVDATSAEVVLELYATLGAVGGSLTISATIWGLLFPS